MNTTKFSLTTYTTAEIEEFFSGRLSFNIMNAQQIKKVLEYISFQTNTPMQVLQERLLVDGLCPHDDAFVYTQLRQIKGKLRDLDEKRMYQHKRSQDLYKKMCGVNGFDFKEPIGSLFDLGDSDPEMLGNLAYQFYLQKFKHFGISLNEHDIIRGIKGDDSDRVFGLFDRLKNNSFGMTFCNSTLHIFGEDVIMDVVDELSRITSKYILIKDFHFQQRYTYTAEMIVENELQNGVLYPSHIPDLIRQHNSRNPGSKKNPADFQNREFCLDACLERFKNNGFVEIETGLRSDYARMGNRKVLILKKTSFKPRTYGTPWRTAEADDSTQWRRPAAPVDTSDDLYKRLVAIAAQNRNTVPSKSGTDQLKEMIQLINKVAPENQALLLPELHKLLREHTSQMSGEELEKYIDGVTNRLIFRVKTSKQAPDLVAQVCRRLVFANSKVAELFTTKVRDLFGKLLTGSPDPEQFMAIYNHSDSFARFITWAAIIKLFPDDFTREFTEKFIEHAENRPDFINGAADALIACKDPKQKPRLNALVNHMKTIVGSVKDGRSRCLMKNIIEAHELAA